jgi:hypothetical protein
VAGHLICIGSLGLAAIWLVLPLTTRLATHVPGYRAGDNVAFVWDTWWFRRAFATGSLGLWCDLLFAPLGTSLVLHTHGILQAAIGLLLCPTESPVVAHNVTLIAGIVANGVCTYAMAFHYTRRSMPSLIAGVMFTWSAFVTIHLAGHFNLVHAWVLPLEAWCVARFLEQPSNGRGAAVAVALATIAYSDYYFLIYALGVTALLTLTRHYTIAVERRPAPPRPVIVAALGAAGIGLALIAAILQSGGWVVHLGPVDLSMRSPRNLAAFTTMALWVAAIATFRIRGTSRPAPGLTVRHWLRAIALFAVIVSPLAIAAAALAFHGGYVSQPLFWRSSPPGIDVATLVEGPRHHLILGELVNTFYRTFEVLPLEQSGWIGLVAMSGVTLALLRYREEPEVRSWLIVAGAFFAIAIGPFVRVGGVDTGIPGPFALLRYVPLLSNARIPGRAMVVVQLAAALLVAMVLARRSTDWRGCVGWLLLLIVEALPRPTSVYPLPRADAIDAAIATAPVAGSVLELPAGIRDGFQMIGWLDHRMLVHQMYHARPIVGGFVARMSPVVRAQYLATPLYTAAFADSDLVSPRNTPLSALEASQQHVAFLVVNRDWLHRLPALSRPALEAGGFRYALTDGDRELYAVEPASRMSTGSWESGGPPSSGAVSMPERRAPLQGWP